MRTLIFGISGKKRTGKDTVAHHLYQRFASKKDRFAAPIKDIVANVFQMTDEQINGSLKETKDERWGFTPRWLQQQIGTNLFRNNIDPDVWSKSLIARAEECNLPIMLVPDVRFPNEVEAIQETGGYVLRLKRPSVESGDLHRSETALDDVPADFFDGVYNNEHMKGDLKVEGMWHLRRASKRFFGKDVDHFRLGDYDMTEAQSSMCRYTRDYDERLDDLDIYSDIDGVLAGFAPAFCRKADEMNVDYHPHFSVWNGWVDGHTDGFREVWQAIKQDRDFWLDTIRPLESAFINFPIKGYVTAFPMASDIRQAWINRHGFPDKAVYTVEPNTSKIDTLRKLEADIFIDDKASTVEEINGDPSLHTRAYLVGSPANQQDMRRIPSIPYVSFLPKQLERDEVFAKESTRVDEEAIFEEMKER